MRLSTSSDEVAGSNSWVGASRENSISEQLKTWKKGQIHLDKFWETWSRSYLQELRESHTLQMKATKGEKNRYPVIGEVVLIKEENQPRGSWKTARVTNLIFSEIDGVPRAAKLSTIKGKLLKRPFKDLYPLEVFDNEDRSNQDRISVMGV